MLGKRLRGYSFVFPLVISWILIGPRVGHAEELDTDPILPGDCDNDNAESHTDLLMVYTPGMRVLAGGYAEVEEMIRDRVDYANQAYINSAMVTRLNLVGIFEVMYQGSGKAATDLGRLKQTDDEYLDEVHDLRNQLGADLVGLYVADFGVGGMASYAYRDNTDDGIENPIAYPEDGFSVVNFGASIHTLAHEIGHNQGTQHQTLTGVGWKAFPYSHGYEHPEGIFSTVMGTNTTNHIPFFSNPQVDYVVDPLDPQSPVYATGVEGSSDAARSIDAASPFVSNFRTCNICEEIEMGEGVGPDCNTNSLNDLCEVYSGAADDLNRNGIPDDCDLDCNDNGVLDSTEIGADFSLDCNQNDVLDACELDDIEDDNLDGVPDMCQANVIYVKKNASGTASGLSWENAFDDLQDALAFTDESYSNVNQIWVASGKYLPVGVGGDRAVSFVLRDGIILYGGFAGDETSLDERDFRANETILSGDIADDDGGDWSQMDENSFHVVTRPEVVELTKLDGFVIEGGRANGQHLQSIGAGLYLSDGVYGDDGLATIANTTFRNNWADSFGGAAYLDSANTQLSNCKLIGNRASDGGGVYGIDSEVVVVSSLLASNDGFAMNFPSGDVRIINVTVSDNASGLYLASAAASVTSSILWNNGDGSYENQIAGVGYFVNYSAVQGWSGAAAGEGNTALDPNLLPEQDYRVLDDSPCIDAGEPSMSPFLPDDDLDGYARVTHCRVDMGAYEESFLFADCNGNFIADACEADCDWNGVPDECEISSDPSVDCPGLGNGIVDSCEVDCDANDVADSCEIASSPALDCDGLGNGIIDACEVDCDQNGVADSCDIVLEPALDCDLNELPDVCEIAQNAALDSDSNGVLDSCDSIPQIVFVNQNADPGGDGASWQTALNDLQEALSLARATSVDEIWVAYGVYTPSLDDRSVSFEMASGVAIYGGFVGNETVRSQRDPYYKETVLSGDLAGDDGSNWSNIEENSFHVVTASSLNAGARLDGFVVEGGRANGFEPNDKRGAGLNVFGAELVVSNATFRRNWSDYSGGGAIVSSGDITFTNSTFIDNVSEHGAALSASGSPDGVGVHGCLFSRNRSLGYRTVVTNISPISIVNSTFVDNLSPAIASFDSTTIRNSIFWNNGAYEIQNGESGVYDISYSNIMGWDGSLGGVGNSGDDPRFIPGTYRPSLSSPCVDSGSNADVAGVLEQDIEGKLRVYNATGLASAIVDRGAYEMNTCSTSGDCQDDNPCTRDYCAPGGYCTQFIVGQMTCGESEESLFDDPLTCDTTGSCSVGCELDWDRNGIVNQADYLAEGGMCSGFYYGWYIESYYPVYWNALCAHVDRDRLDRNRDGVVNGDDLMGTLSVDQNSEGYYAAWYLFSYYPASFEVLLPEYHCDPTQ